MGAPSRGRRLTRPTPDLGKVVPRSNAVRRLVGAVPGLIATAGIRAFVLFWVGFTVLVLGWVILTSIRSTRQLFADPFGLPNTVHLENFERIWVGSGLGAYFGNSLGVTGIACLGVMVVGVPAAYALSRFTFSGRDWLLTGIVAGMGVPTVLLAVPVFLLLNTIGLIDSLAGLVIVYIAVSLPFTVLLLTGFFASLSQEVEEAAMVDGAGEFRIFLTIMVPMAWPGILTTFLLNAIFLWKEFFWANLLVQTDGNRTLALGLNAVRETLIFGSDWVGLFAAVTIMLVPVLMLYALLSRRIMKGFAFG